VRIWKEWRKDRSIILPILDDIRELGFCFEAFSISLVRPIANHPAHNCTIFACNNVSSNVWLGTSPQFLEHNLLADL
jgi:hypothetical protein